MFWSLESDLNNFILTQFPNVLVYGINLTYKAKSITKFPHAVYRTKHPTKQKWSRFLLITQNGPILSYNVVVFKERFVVS